MPASFSFPARHTISSLAAASIYSVVQWLAAVSHPPRAGASHWPGLFTPAAANAVATDAAAGSHAAPPLSFNLIYWQLREHIVQQPIALPSHVYKIMSHIAGT